MTDPLPAPPAAADAAAVHVYLVIQGETQAGAKFRPSDWCDRLHSTLRALGDKAEEYADFIHIVTIEGQRCLMIEMSLEDIDAALYNFFLSFARDNNLMTRRLTRAQWDALRG